MVGAAMSFSRCSDHPSAAAADSTSTFQLNQFDPSIFSLGMVACIVTGRVSKGDLGGLKYIMERALRGFSCPIRHVNIDVCIRIDYPQTGASAEPDKMRRREDAWVAHY